MVYGDARGCVNIRLRRGETHIESMLHRFYGHALAKAGPSDIACQLDYVATHYRHPMLIVVVSDEPEVDDHLDEAVTRLAARHEVMWAMVSDMPAVGATPSGRDGFDVATGRFVFGQAAMEPRIVTAYRRAEERRRRQLDEFLTSRAIPHTTIEASSQIRTRITKMNEVFARAG